MTTTNKGGRPRLAPETRLVQARVPAALHAKLAREARRRNTTIAEVIREKLNASL